MNYLVIGASGTMGKLVVHELAKFNENRIVGMSRDEQKIARMPRYPNVTYRVGDIRDKDRLFQIMVRGFMGRSFDVVINLAALKCVDILEANPWEAIQTNVVGSQNLIDVAVMTARPKIIFTSTDKAVYPINIYGTTKATAEYLYRQYDGPCTVFRYGNILGSRGSVLHKFVEQLNNNLPLTITSTEMTRFWVRSTDICQEIIKEAGCLERANKLKIVYSKSMKMLEVANAVSKCLGKGSLSDFEVIGFRPGEKLHECLSNYTDENVSPVLIGHSLYPGSFTGFDTGFDCHSNEYTRYTSDEFTDLIEPIISEILK
ncbi:polysaccharide biosynthesis protein [bacterium]|nr:polysaccharide biosynthesis protein [bacterium]